MGGIMSLMDVTFGEDEAYITVGRGKVARSREVAPGVVLDLDEKGEAVGLELLGLRRRRLRAGQVVVRIAKKQPGHDADEHLLAELLNGGTAQAL
jgi:uncharacterized protein YuzE